MKTALKILVLVLITAFAMLSCETSPSHQPCEKKPHLRPDDFYKLHHHIRPSKPIKIPDTMAIKMKTAILESQADTLLSNPQDSIPQE